MKKLLLLILTIATINMVGCTTMKYNHAPQFKQLDWPDLNKQTTVYVGEEMLIQGFSIKDKNLHIKTPVNGICYDIPRGMYAMNGEDKKYYFFSAVGVVGAVLCDPFSGITVPKKTPGKVCVLTMFGVNSCYDATYEIVETETARSDSRQQSLLYSGSEGNQAKFTYIETYGGKVPFTHDVTYDLNKSSIINYRGARIQLHSATNESVTYTVIQNFANRQ